MSIVKPFIKKRPTVSFWKSKTLVRLKNFWMRTNILELSIFFAFALKYATSYSYLKIKVGFGVRMAFFLPVHCTLELVPGKITLLPVLDSASTVETGKT